jgi:hypothetical protein
VPLLLLIFRYQNFVPSDFNIRVQGGFGMRVNGAKLINPFVQFNKPMPTIFVTSRKWSITVFPAFSQ